MNFLVIHLEIDLHNFVANVICRFCKLIHSKTYFDVLTKKTQID